jgi:hypothetical protein
MSEFDTGYSVDIGKPVVHAEKKATGSSVSFPCEAIHDGSYLVSLEVNGSVKAYRESMDFSSGSCTVGEYTLSYSSYALTVSGTSNNDIVRVMVEPLEVKTTDAFRAAVKKDAPKSEGGGSGGGVLVVTDTNGTLDKTWKEIHDAMLSGGSVVSFSETDIGSIVVARYNNKGEEYTIKAYGAGGSFTDYVASSADGYPTNA